MRRGTYENHWDKGPENWVNHNQRFSRGNRRPNFHGFNTRFVQLYMLEWFDYPRVTSIQLSVNDNISTLLLVDGAHPFYFIELIIANRIRSFLQ